MPVKFDVLKTHFLKYFPSLNFFKDRYKDIFFEPNTAIPGHYAYVCPLCLKNGLLLLEDERFLETIDFTLDHFPPEAVGGKSTLLVCQKCNNEAGAKFEGSLKLKMEGMSFNNKVSTAKVKAKSQITAVKGNYPTMLTVKDNGELEISFKPSPKIHSPLLDDWLANSKNDLNWTTEVTIPVADENKVSKALLKAAYLYCFQYWGYDFAYSNTGENIRKVINDEAIYPLNNPSFWLGEVAKTVPRIQLGLCYIKSPEKMKSFVLNMLLTDKETGYHNIASVLISGPMAQDWQHLSAIQKILDYEPTMNITFEHVSNYSISDGVINGYYESWAYLQSIV